MGLDKHIPRSVGTILTYGQEVVDVSGTAKILVTTAETVWLQIRAKEDNAGVIYVGDSDVDSSNGFILTTTSPDVIMRFDHNSDNIYLDAESSSDGVSFVGWR